MNKRDLVKWAEKEKVAAIEKAEENAKSKIAEIDEFYYNQLGVNEFLDAVIPHFKKAFEEYDKFFSKIDSTEKVSISKYNFHRGYYAIESLSDRDAVKHSIVESLKFSSLHDRTKKVCDVRNELTKVKHTYDTVIETLKNLPTAKDGLAYLKKLGFDVSKIEPAKHDKQLPATTDVNVDIKYLLLNKDN